MEEYLVTWEIQVSADSHAGAACVALEMLQDPASTATFFGVRKLEPEGEAIVVDIETGEEYP